MNDESRPHGRPIASAPSRLARPPALIIRLEIEQQPELFLDADTFEDEQRLRLWLQRGDALRRIGETP